MAGVGSNLDGGDGQGSLDGQKNVKIPDFSKNQKQRRELPDPVEERAKLDEKVHKATIVVLAIAGYSISQAERFISPDYGTDLALQLVEAVRVVIENSSNGLKITDSKPGFRYVNLELPSRTVVGLTDGEHMPLFEDNGASFFVNDVVEIITKMTHRARLRKESYGYVNSGKIVGRENIGKATDDYLLDHPYTEIAEKLQKLSQEHKFRNFGSEQLRGFIKEGRDVINYSRKFVSDNVMDSDAGTTYLQALDTNLRFFDSLQEDFDEDVEIGQVFINNVETIYTHFVGYTAAWAAKNYYSKNELDQSAIIEYSNRLLIDHAFLGMKNCIQILISRQE